VKPTDVNRIAIALVLPDPVNRLPLSVQVPGIRLLPLPSGAPGTGRDIGSHSGSVQARTRVVKDGIKD